MRWMGLLLLVFFAGCGGRVETEPDPNAETPSADPWAGTPLGDCEPGVAPGQGPCPWTYEGLCYPTKAKACDCACPRDRDSLCVSELTKASSFNRVECF